MHAKSSHFIWPTLYIIAKSIKIKELQNFKLHAKDDRNYQQKEYYINRNSYYTLGSIVHTAIERSVNLSSSRGSRNSVREGPGRGIEIKKLTLNNEWRAPKARCPLRLRDLGERRKLPSGPTYFRAFGMK